jgi:hypothetical protein
MANKNKILNALKFTGFLSRWPLMAYIIFRAAFLIFPNCGGRNCLVNILFKPY